MVSVTGIIISLFVVLSIVNVVRSDDSQFLEKIFFECNRQCETHFSHSSCWEKTFEYFTNNLLQSVVDYANAQSRTRGILKDDLIDALFSKYLEYKNESDVEDFVDNIVPEFDQIFNRTLTKLPRLTPENVANKEVKCPLSCKSEWFIVWISLFGVFLGLTFATLVFLTIYISIVKGKLRRFEKLSKT